MRRAHRRGLHAQGHAIKNAKTQLSQCLHSLPARRRLIISGTPIQNRLGELWTLFDFVCPVRPDSDNLWAVASSEHIQPQLCCNACGIPIRHGELPTELDAAAPLHWPLPEASIWT